MRVDTAGHPERSRHHDATRRVEVPLVTQEAFNRAKLISQIVAGNPDMPVKLGKPGGGSFFDIEAKIMTLDPVQIIEDSFCAPHEGAHAAITPGFTEMEMGQEQVEKYYSQIGFSSGEAAAEENRVNTWLIRQYPGIEELVRRTYDAKFSNEEAVLDTSEIQRDIIKFGYVPLYASYCTEIMRDWHQGHFREGLDPNVQQALNQSIRAVRERTETFPDSRLPAREDVIADGKRAFEIYLTQIWPEIQKLVEIDLNHEQIRQMISDQKQTAQALQDAQDALEQINNHPHEQKRQQRKQELEEQKQALEEQISALQQEQEKLEERMEELNDPKHREWNKKRKRKKVEAELTQKQAQKEGAEKELEEAQAELQEVQTAPEEKQNLERKIDQLKQKLEQFGNIPQEVQDEINEALQQAAAQAKEKLDQQQETNLQERIHAQEKQQKLEREIEALRQQIDQASANDAGQTDNAQQLDERGQSTQQTPSSFKQNDESDGERGNDQLSSGGQLQRRTNQAGQGGSIPPSDMTTTSDEQQRQQSLEELRTTLQHKLDELATERARSKELAQEADKVQKARNDLHSNNHDLPFPIDQLSSHAKQTLKEMFDKLPEYRKVELRQQAESRLKDLEDKFAKEMQSKLNQDNPKTHEEIRRIREHKDDRQKRTMPPAETIRLAPSQEEIEFSQAFHLPPDGIPGSYEVRKEALAPLIESLYNRLAKIIPPRTQRRRKPGYSSGIIPNMQLAMQAEADPTLLTKLWEREKTKTKERDFALSILVDLSGSMGVDNKIHKAIDGLIVLVEAAKRFNIDLEIIGFQADTYLFKPFDTNLDPQTEDKLASAIQAPFSLNGYDQSHNSDGFALLQAYQRVNNVKAKNKFIVVFSDGLPAPDDAHARPEWMLDQVIPFIRAQQSVSLVGVGIGKGTDHVKTFYGRNGTVCENVEQLPEFLSELVENMILNPYAFMNE